jgi:hypothetical protein
VQAPPALALPAELRVLSYARPVPTAGQRHTLTVAASPHFRPFALSLLHGLAGTSAPKAAVVALANGAQGFLLPPASAEALVGEPTFVLLVPPPPPLPAVAAAAAASPAPEQRPARRGRPLAALRRPYRYLLMTLNNPDKVAAALARRGWQDACAGSGAVGSPHWRQSDPVLAAGSWDLLWRMNAKLQYRGASTNVHDLPPAGRPQLVNRVPDPMAISSKSGLPATLAAYCARGAAAGGRPPAAMAASCVVRGAPLEADPGWRQLCAHFAAVAQAAAGGAAAAAARCGRLGHAGKALRGQHVDCEARLFV